MIAVIDIGKTNAKLAIVDLKTLEERAVITRPNVVLTGPPYPHFDTEGHWQFLIDGLRDFHAVFGIEAISITTHGACAALLDAEGNLAAPILDYEHEGPNAHAAQYDKIRPDFDETGAPRLPMGLNVGAQLHWQFATDVGLHARVKTIVTYPQYWGHRLTGRAAIDMSSIGCHTDLWNPMTRAPSSLVDRLNIREKLAPVRPSGDILGPILPHIAAQTGLSPATPVVCGIHDSNASLFPHIIARDTPVSVVSTGTWVIVMSAGETPPTLDAGRDSLMNVDAFGHPVPSARFMGGREFEFIQNKAPLVATTQDADHVLAEEIMLLPAVEPNSGPFQGRELGWVGGEPAFATGTREIALSYYLALMSAECLALTGGSGEIIVEGPFARNPFYLAMLAAVCQRRVTPSTSSTGTSIGAALLFAPHRPPEKAGLPVELQEHEARRLRRYGENWKRKTQA